MKHPTKHKPEAEAAFDPDDASVVPEVVPVASDPSKESIVVPSIRTMVQQMVRVENHRQRADLANRIEAELDILYVAPPVPETPEE